MEADRKSIRHMLRKSLLPTDRADYSKRYWPKWIEDRLTTLAIYSYSDKEQCLPAYMQCLRLYSKGYDYSAIGADCGLKHETVEKYIIKALDWIIDNTPENLLINIPVEHTKYRLKGCPKCHGDLMWDDADGSYWCLACSRTYNETNQPMTFCISIS
jgi:hypothetical protein